MNLTRELRSIALADDFVVYVTDKNPQKIQPKLEKIVNKINDYYKQWFLKINGKKCETILFRKRRRYLAKCNRDGWREFQIAIKDNAGNIVEPIPHKSMVKYLGVYVDQLLRLHKHPLT